MSDLFSVVVFHRCMVDWGDKVDLNIWVLYVKLIQCSGVPSIYGKLEEGGKLDLHVHFIFSIQVSLLLCRIVIHPSLCIHNYRWITTVWHTNNYQNQNKKINLHESFYSHSFCCCSVCCCCPCVIMYTKQQQHEIISTTKTTKKLEIDINCFIFISDKCMTYLSNSSTPNGRM